jgi:hypothetical protein
MYLLLKFTHGFEMPFIDRQRQEARTYSAWLRHLESYAKISEHALLEHVGCQCDKYLDNATERALYAGTG